MSLSLQCWLARKGHGGPYLSFTRLISTFIPRAAEDYHYSLKYGLSKSIIITAYENIDDIVILFHTCAIICVYNNKNSC